MKKTRTLLNRL